MIVDLEEDILLWNMFLTSFKHLNSHDLDEEKKYNPYIHYLFYKVDDKIVGFLNYSKIYDRMEINQIEVLEDYRHQHIGSQLIEKLLSIAKDNNILNITLEVRCDNNIAVNLYTKYGFIKKAIRQGYYSGIDGILMEKEMRYNG